MLNVRSEDRLQQSLDDVVRLLQKHRVLETLTHRQEGPRRDLLEQLQHRQNLAELHNKVRTLHPADVAFILEALPPNERLVVWEQLEPQQRGPVLVELGDAVRDSVIEHTDRDALVQALTWLDPDDLAYLADKVPEGVLREVSRSLDVGERTWLQSSISYPEDTVGHLMTHELVALRDSLTISEAVVELRALEEWPSHTDRIFIVDVRNVLRGVVPLADLIRHDPGLTLAQVMTTDPATFMPEDRAAQASQAFERYDLVSAPVVDDRGKLVGRLTVDTVMDFLREEAERRAIQRAGLSAEEDIYAPTWYSARNRWPWLCVNLVTAFLASRVIGLFEGTIDHLVALATLMPIVASVGGNTGNQTIAVVVRGLALNQIQTAQAGRLVQKELTVALLNGLVWGGIMGLFAILIYGHVALGLVMTTAILLNLAVAALVGIAVPVVLQRLGRDPAQGASVLLTFLTDSMGFFLFLGLAQVFLTP